MQAVQAAPEAICGKASAVYNDVHQFVVAWIQDAKQVAAVAATSTQVSGKAAYSQIAEQACQAVAATKAKAYEVGTTLKATVVDKKFQATAGSATAGAVTMGAAAGGTGLVAGGAIGGALGVVPAIFTFGLSIPIGAAIGAGMGLVMGTTAGSMAGAVGGGVTGRVVYTNKEAIGQALEDVKQKAADTRKQVQDKVQETTTQWRNRKNDKTEPATSAVAAKGAVFGA